MSLTPESEFDGDSGFIGVDERTNPAQLAPGYLARAENLRFRNGVAEPRFGDQLLLCMTSGGATPWTEIYTAARYKNATTGQDLWLIAADGNTYYTAPGMAAAEIPLPSGVTLTRETAIQFVQCFNVVILLRGPLEEPLVMRKFDLGFEFISQTPSGTGTLPIPPSSFALYYGNRLLVANDRDEVAISDPLDYTRYFFLNEFRINQGDNDRLVAMQPFNESTILMLKEQTVWRVDNVSGDLADVALRNVTTKYGCIAPFSVVDYGTDVAWLSERGIVTLRLTEQNEVQGTDVSLSDPLALTMDRLNWAYAANCVAESWDNKLYFAVPLDDAHLLSETDLGQTGGGTYSISNLTITGLTAGETYLYTQESDDDLYLINGNHRLDGSGYFVAASTTAQINGTNDAAVTATVRKVMHRGVNNAVLVFDNVTKAWCGIDTRERLNIRRWTRLPINGRTRLCYVSNDGETRVYEEGVTDETFQTVSPAYADVIAVDYPDNGTTLQVGGGTTVTADSSATQNTGAGTWAASSTLSVNQIGNALWLNNDRGYSDSAGTQWTYGGAYTIQALDGGVRFVSTNTILPTIAVDAVSVTSSGFYGSNQDSNLPEAAVFVDCHSGTEPQPVPIVTDLTTRGYHGGKPFVERFGEWRLQLASWSPTFTVSVVLPGIGEESVAYGPKTFDRSTYSGGTAGSYDTTNANNDHATARREDYSVVLDDGQAGVDLGDTGVAIEREQHFELHDQFSSVIDWYAQIRIRNTTGRLTLRASSIESKPNANGMGVKM